jgi:alpha-L-rhamnosidase
MQITANPIKIYDTLYPISIHREGDAFIYDFGENNTGITELEILADEGQTVTLDHGEWLKDGIFSQDNILFNNDASRGKPRITQRIEYVARGGGKVETYRPRFTFFGFRYVRVRGITEAQATPQLLKYHLMSSLSERRGSFTSSNEDLNRLYDMTMRSVVSNFMHFPLDCPHREKNGWTADAALTASLCLMSFDPEKNYRDWVRCVARAMTEDGVLPGIVPTDRWGYTGCNGPAWDSALIWLPYWTARLRGDLAPARAVSGAMLKYLHCLFKTRDERGLITVGLGDHCAPNEMAPNVVSCSITTFDLCVKAEYIYKALGMIPEAEYCRALAAAMRKSVREHLIEDNETMRVFGNCQTSQAMALYYGIFDEGEYGTAYATLISQIRAKDDHLAVGCLGSRVLFRLLSENGDADLAIKMITRRDAPSYGFLLDAGYTTLTEKIVPSQNSFNHHFFGDIAAVMVEYFAGIHPNPKGQGANTVLVSPTFPASLDFASASYVTVAGKLDVSWQRDKLGRVTLKITAPEALVLSTDVPPEVKVDILRV